MHVRRRLAGSRDGVVERRRYALPEWSILVGKRRRFRRRSTNRRGRTTFDRRAQAGEEHPRRAGAQCATAAQDHDVRPPCAGASEATTARGRRLLAGEVPAGHSRRVPLRARRCRSLPHRGGRMSIVTAIGELMRSGSTSNPGGSGRERHRGARGRKQGSPHTGGDTRHETPRPSSGVRASGRHRGPPCRGAASRTPGEQCSARRTGALGSGNGPRIPARGAGSRASGVLCPFPCTWPRPCTREWTQLGVEGPGPGGRPARDAGAQTNALRSTHTDQRAQVDAHRPACTGIRADAGPLRPSPSGPMLSPFRPPWRGSASPSASTPRRRSRGSCGPS